MTTHQEHQFPTTSAGTPSFRTVDGVSIRFVESEPKDVGALLLRK